MRFSPKELVGQFILCRNSEFIPEDWVVRKQGEWCLGTHPTLPVIDIHATDLSIVGWFLGWPISPQGVLLQETVNFPIHSSTADASLVIERSLYEYGGRWAAVSLVSSIQRFYLDACGSLAAVFSPRHEIVASTPSLIPYSNGCVNDQELIEDVMVAGEDCGFPFGLTPRRFIERLLPNHFLDLRNWNGIRHWPVKDFEIIHDTKLAVTEFAELLKKQIAAVATARPYCLPLTAGRDSRVLLACSKESLSVDSLFTVEMPTKAAALDCQIVRRMAHKLGLNHQVLPFSGASPEELDLFSFRTGYCVDGLSLHYSKIFQWLNPQHPLFWGAAGELGRSYHWRSGDSEFSEITVDDLLKRLSRLLPGAKGSQVASKAQVWLENMPVSSALSVWGLMYNEQYNGCWVGPKEYGYTHNCFRIWPFCHRRLIEIMLSLPTEYRRQNKFEIDVIESQWRELLEYPFNWPMGWRKAVFFLARRVQSRWRRFLSKLRYQ